MSSLPEPTPPPDRRARRRSRSQQEVREVGALLLTWQGAGNRTPESSRAGSLNQLWVCF